MNELSAIDKAKNEVIKQAAQMVNAIGTQRFNDTSKQLIGAYIALSDAFDKLKVEQDAVQDALAARGATPVVPAWMPTPAATYPGPPAPAMPMPGQPVMQGPVAVGMPPTMPPPAKSYAGGTDDQARKRYAALRMQGIHLIAGTDRVITSISGNELDKYADELIEKYRIN